MAEAEFERDVRSAIRGALYWGSGDAPRHPDSDTAGRRFMVPRGGGWLANRPNPASLPPWLSETDVDFYVTEFTRTGFGGGLNWYRNIDRSWELLAPLAGARVRRRRVDLEEKSLAERRQRKRTSAIRRRQ